jgi:hypothetical protein
LDPEAEGDLAAVVRAGRAAGHGAACALRSEGLPVTEEPRVVYAALSPEDLARALRLTAEAVRG